MRPTLVIIALAIGVTCVLEYVAALAPDPFDAGLPAAPTRIELPIESARVGPVTLTSGETTVTLQIVGDRVILTVAGDAVPIPPPGPDPPDNAFTKWVAGETAKVEATNHDEIGATFRALATRIDAGDLRGSAAIQSATKAALFGPEATLNAEWGPWFNTVFPYMLNTLRLVTQQQWAAHYRMVGKAVTL